MKKTKKYRMVLTATGRRRVEAGSLAAQIATRMATGEMSNADARNSNAVTVFNPPLPAAGTTDSTLIASVPRLPRGGRRGRRLGQPARTARHGKLSSGKRKKRPSTGSAESSQRSLTRIGRS